MDNPTVKLLTNYHTTANMSPLPTEILRERERKKKKSLGHIHLNSRVAIQKANKRERKIKFIGPNPPLLISRTTVETHAKDLERKSCLLVCEITKALHWNWQVAIQHLWPIITSTLTLGKAFTHRS